MGTLSPFLRSFARRLFIGGALTLALTTAGQAEMVSAEVKAELSAEALVRAISQAVSGEPLSIIAREKGLVRVETSAAGFDYLLSEAALTEVTRLSPEIAEAAPSKLARYQVALKLIGAKRADGASHAEASRLKTSAVYVGRKSAPPSSAGFDRAGHDTLIVRGLDARGAEISRQVVADPRVVRGEAVGADGTISGRVDFIRAEALLEVDLADDPRIAALVISAPGHGVLARVSIR